VDRLLASEEAEDVGLGGGVGEGGFDLGGSRSRSGRRRGRGAGALVGVGGGRATAGDVELVGELLHEGVVLGARAPSFRLLLRHVPNPNPRGAAEILYPGFRGDAEILTVGFVLDGEREWPGGVVIPRIEQLCRSILVL
jgi:hypothetical protein